jgi:hypothetical protein
MAEGGNIHVEVATDCDEGDIRVVVRMDSDEGDVQVVARPHSGAPLNDLAEEMSVQGGVAVGRRGNRPCRQWDDGSFSWMSDINEAQSFGISKRSLAKEMLKHTSSSSRESPSPMGSQCSPRWRQSRGIARKGRVHSPPKPIVPQTTRLRSTK